MKKTGIGNAFKQQVLGGGISLNDLREREFSGKSISDEQAKALENYDRYRINTLNQQQSEEAFHAKYLELQAMANLSPYQEFLKPPYTPD